MEDPRAKGRLMSARDTHLRSVCKAISWRVIATLTTTLIAYFVTGKWETALFIGGWEALVKIVVYTLHERVWEHIPFGRREPEYYI
ncbi:Protein of unknown function DUF2061, membrane [Spirochaeta thermophila DSM 6578]|uniref:DUF2061 domain-containing protein n=1 Tax=Winmispira thermophila (strain ATCC 700085 / DSM 6578 / Z-1203) TaxID=869211 RepID=G0GBD1_WINT7|nr:DUF2061 domain-containing protein [Spirochaeta thermophila]AEJ61940.1 Protein of unknown function DUF2061, membrane [Spirochaeta thermophila DSM 6578]